MVKVAVLVAVDQLVMPCALVADGLPDLLAETHVLQTAVGQFAGKLPDHLGDVIAR